MLRRRALQRTEGDGEAAALTCVGPSLEIRPVNCALLHPPLHVIARAGGPVGVRDNLSGLPLRVGSGLPVRALRGEGARQEEMPDTHLSGSERHSKPVVEDCLSLECSCKPSSRVRPRRAANKKGELERGYGSCGARAGKPRASRATLRDHAPVANAIRADAGPGVEAKGTLWLEWRPHWPKEGGASISG